ncbi:DNA gyrase subunit A [compost metagenome]
MIITTSGTLIRTSMDGISTMGRYAQGVKLINIREDDAVATLCRADKEEDELPDHEDGEDGQDTLTVDTEAVNDSEPLADAEGEEDSLE